ncbi:MAG: hypothetical protein JNL61_00345 [Rhizobiaceae bacterium]|nr:hypothetical protein [Rhizobiaceae bacterium]
MKTSVGVFLAVAVLAGCQSSSGSGPSSPAPGVGQQVAAAQMPDFCRAQAAQQLRVNLVDLSTDDPVVKSSGTIITGEWDSPDNDWQIVPFQCRFDPTGTFMGVTR